MKLLKREKTTVTICENITLEFCSRFLTENITDFKSLTPEILEQLELWFSGQVKDKIMFLAFERQMRDLYHYDGRTRYNNLKYWTRRGYSQEEAATIVGASQGKKLKSSVEYWIDKGHSREEAEILRSENQGAASKKNRENLEALHGKEEAAKLIKARNREASHWSLEHWIAKGLNGEEAREALFEVQSRDWADEQKENHKGTSKRSVEYWLKQGFSQEEAKAAVTDYQTMFSLEICIEKYGEEAGLKRWQDRQVQWHKNFKKSNYSKISQELFHKLRPHVPESVYALRYGSGNAEHVFKTVAGSVYKLDFWVPSSKKIIEFDGDYWHSPAIANPAREAKRTAEILETDAEISLMRVKEHDFRNDPEKTVQHCLEFLNS